METTDRTRELEDDANIMEVTKEDSVNENSQNHWFPAISDNKKRRRSRFPHRPYASPTNRIITKYGKYNVLYNNLPQKNSRYFRDLGNTLLSIRWRWILVSVCVANAIVYVAFTILWMIIVAWEESYMDENHQVPCIIGGSSFTAYLILVVETITTIGSGEIYPTDCQSGWIIITFQALAGIAIEGALISIVFAKMSRPRIKDTTKHFSKKATICLRDGIYCLLFRVQDIQEKYWARTNIKAILIKKKSSSSCESSPYYFENLKLEDVGLMMWPQEVIHKITKDSPLWNMSKHDLYKYRFEILFVLEGDSLTTGEPFQSRTSYTNKEVLWGYRFKPCVEYDDPLQKYIVNANMFNDVIESHLPDCSAEEFSLLLSNNMKLES